MLFEVLSVLIIAVVWLLAFFLTWRNEQRLLLKTPSIELTFWRWVCYMYMRIRRYV